MSNNATVFDEFDNCEIKNASIKFNSAEAAIKFGCLGKIDVSSNITTVSKKCEGRVVKKKTRVTDLVVSLTSHVNKTVDKDLVGMKNDGLKEGIYAYGENSFCEKFTFCAEIEDMDGNKKLVAFPNCSNAKGLTLTVDNDATEIALKELEFSAMMDNYGKFYYEAEQKDLVDENVKEKWLTDFNYDLVKLEV